MIILDTTYFGNICLVLVDAGYELKSYIRDIKGISAKESPLFTASYGSKFPIEAALEIFPQYKNTKPFKLKEKEGNKDNE